MSKKPFRTENSILSRFTSDKRANVGIIFGIILLPLMIAMGSAVDYSRAYTKQKSLATAVDTAVLAGGVFSEQTEEFFEEKIRRTLYANFPESEVASLSFGRDPVTKAVTVTATANVDTLLAGIWNVHNIPIAATAQATPTRNWAEIVLVLDNTGSMGQGSGKIEALREAAKDLVEILHDSSPDTDKLFISLVPFTATVKLSNDLLNWSGIDLAGQSSISGEDFSGNKNVIDIFADLDDYAWNGCIRARPGGNDLLDTLASPGDPETLFPVYFAPDEADHAPDGSNNGFRNNGRKSSNGDQYRNLYIDDEDLGLGNRARVIQRDTNKYSTETPDPDLSASGPSGPEYNCPVQAILPLTTNKTTLDTAIDGMTARGNTNIATGLAWGWRMLTPEAPYEARTFDGETKKFIILLTDGNNDIGSTYRSVNHNQTRFSAYGYATNGHLGNVNGNDAEDVLDTKLQTLCRNAKGFDAVSGTYDDTKEIRIFTITFQLNDANTQDIFRNCATTPDMYYNSPDNATLQTTFQEIANELLKLHLSK